MMMTKSDDDMIDALFAQARTQSPAVPDDLMARVLADAADMLVHSVAAPKPRIWPAFLELIGGWPSVGGLAMAGVAGIWVGLAPPASVTTWAADLIGSPVSIDLLSDTSGYFAEGLLDG
jgi:hypothetical protein